MKNQEELGDEVKIDTKDQKVDALSNKKQERNISKIEESHSIVSSHEDYSDVTDQHIVETCAKVQENAYEIKFVRCNCAYVQSHSS